MTLKNPFVVKWTDLGFPWRMRRNSAGILISVAEGTQHTPNLSQVNPSSFQVMGQQNALQDFLE